MLKHKFRIVKAFCAVLLAICIAQEGLSLFFEFQVLAAATPTPTAGILDGIATAAALLMTVLEFFAFLIFHFLQALLDPLFIMDMAGTEALRNIWMYSRDLMNVLFAFMLIAAGIYTVVTGNKEVVQQKYKKFILAVILVNFSWFFPRVIFDVANVLTATIYQIPSGLSNGVVDCRLPPAKIGEVGKKCQVYKDITYGEACVDKIKNEGYLPAVFDQVCYKTADWDTDTNTAFGMLNGLVMNYGRLPDLPRVLKPAGGPAVAGDASKLLATHFVFILHIIFVLALMLMLFLPLAAMFVVFLIRIPIIWVTVAFMPFMFLGFVMGDQMKQFDSMKIFHKFVAAAFLPAAVAVPFAAGFMILSQVTQVDCTTTVVAAGLGFCKDMGPIIHGVNTIWGLLMLLIGFFIIWMGFWAALSIDDLYVQATGAIKSFGEQAGKVAVKIPFSAPIIPTGKKGEKMSILGLDDKMRQMSGNLSGGKTIFGDKDDSGQKVVKALNDPHTALNKTLADIGTAIGKSGGTKADMKTRVQADLANASSKLSESLTKIGVDHKTVSADEIIRQMEASGQKDITDVIAAMNKNAKPPATPPATPAP